MRGLFPFPRRQRAIARVQVGDGEAIGGTAILVAERLVLTCTHVLQFAVRGDVQRGTRVKLRFPFSDLPTNPVDGTVLRCLPRLPDDRVRESLHDCALIELDEPAPRGALPCEFSSEDPAELERADVELRGFPADTLKLSGAAANITAIAEADTFELQRRQGAREVWIREGFSGCPLWRSGGDEVVGMVQTSDKRDIAYAISGPGIRKLFGDVSALAARLPARRRAGAALRVASGERENPTAIRYYLLDRDRQHGVIVSRVRETRREPRASCEPHCFCLMGKREDELQHFTDRLRYDTLPTAVPELEGAIEDFEVRFEAHARQSTSFDRLVAAIQIEAAEHVQPGRFPPISRGDALAANAHIHDAGDPAAFVSLPAVESMVETMAQAGRGAVASRLFLITSMFEQAGMDRYVPLLFPYWRAFWAAVMQRDPRLDVFLFVRVQLAAGLRRWLAPNPAAWCDPRCGLVLLDRPGLVTSAQLTAWIDGHVVKDACYPPDIAHYRRRGIEKRCRLENPAPMRRVIEAAMAEFNPELHAP